MSWTALGCLELRYLLFFMFAFLFDVNHALSEKKEKSIVCSGSSWYTYSTSFLLPSLEGRVV